MRRIYWLAAILFLSAFVILGQDGMSPSLQRDLDFIFATVSEFRWLDAIEMPAVVFLSPEEAAADIKEYFAEAFPPERLATLYLFYRALDLAPAGLDLGALHLEYLQQSTRANYDVDNKMIRVILPSELHGRGLPPEQSYIYAHEFVHALQDQHFDLAAFLAAGKADAAPESWLARSALMEGDAMQMMILFLFQLPEDDERIPRGAFSEADMLPLPEKLPRVILAENNFIYFEGRKFIEALPTARGWAGVNRAFREEPPTTSEQILHPQRYLKGEGAMRIDFPPQSQLLDAGWRIGYEGAVGEFYLRQHLKTSIASSHARRYADGWGGDLLRIYTDEADDELMWTWHQVWDRVNEAEQFAKGYAYFLDHRYFGRYQRERADELCWVGADSSHCFARISETETRISMAANRATALALLQLDS